MKRLFDFVLALIIFCSTFWLILLMYIVATIDTKNGLFMQERIGQYGKKFKIIKLRTMKITASTTINATAHNDSRITKFGRILRNTKLDELPEIINILFGHMSFVGPRPEVPGYADKLFGEDTLILRVKPGITGPATLKYINEEKILSQQNNPQKYNDKVIYPDKVKINLDYIRHYSFTKDLYYVYKTIFK